VFVLEIRRRKVADRLGATRRDGQGIIERVRLRWSWAVIM
jgi:hypothetical protein